jgi:hypothetical protein
MSDGDFPNVEPGSVDGQAPELPPPDPQYDVAKTDSRIVIRMYGNTPQVAEMKFLACTPEHLWAAAKRLEWEANKMQAMSDAQQARMGIQTTDKMPPQRTGGFVRP